MDSSATKLFKCDLGHKIIVSEATNRFPRFFVCPIGGMIGHLGKYLCNFSHFILPSIRCTIQNFQTCERFCCSLYRLSYPSGRSVTDAELCPVGPPKAPTHRRPRATSFGPQVSRRGPDGTAPGPTGSNDGADDTLRSHRPCYAPKLQHHAAYSLIPELGLSALVSGLTGPVHTAVV